MTEYMKTSWAGAAPAWFGVLAAAIVPALFSAPASVSDRPALRILFLGDNGHHRPADRFKQLEPLLARHNIELDYTEALDDLSRAKLAGYDGLIIYANQTKISPDQEKALLDFVAEGGGLAALHCASYCFLNSEKYIALVGGQFKSHGTGVFQETIVKPDHPVMQGLSPIQSWDETYVHEKHNPNRIVLAERREGSQAEPYTWVREHGKGRVFYTAWGHDQRTWSNPQFVALVEQGVRWASANSPGQPARRTGLAPFEYMDSPAPLPNYVAGAKWGTQADPIRTMQKPLPVEESQKHLATLPDFQVSLFAAEPEIIKPIWLAWDERGRLWVAETVDYPNQMQPKGQGRDRLKICEDTNGDGRADKFTIFADHLSVPTSFVFANGGVIVVHSGQTEFLKDTDGDGKADVRQVLFTGWGTGDTHAGPSNLRYGFDGWIWGVVGYSGFKGSVGGKAIQFGQGIYRFKPDGSALEFVRSSNNNTWGLAFSEEDIVFGSTANGNASMYLPIPNRYYEAVQGWSASRLETIADSQRFYPVTEKIRQVDFHGRYTAGAGSALYTARQFPREYWNRIQFVAEPTGHLLGKFHLESRGSDFVAHNGRNFLASDDEWTAPIAAEVGPDGALWIIDWYNYIIQHNPTPRGFETGKGNAYETPLRDKEHGRIYRISYSGPSAGLASGARTSTADRAPLRAPDGLGKASPEQLVAGLKNDNLLWRMHAQRLLVERGKIDVVPALCELARDRSVDELGLNAAAIHALWTLSGLGALTASEGAGNAAVIGALRHPSAGVRRAAAMVLPRTADALAALLSKNLLADPDAQVRLAALLAVSEMPGSPGAARAVFAMLSEPRNAEDHWIPDAATSAAARNDADFLKAVLANYQPGAGAPPDNDTRTNLLPNASFEEDREGKPLGWRVVNYSGRAELAVAPTGHSGQRSAKIVSQQGADASWSARAEVRPHTEYRLTGWIKTENVGKLGSAYGAMLNVHELQDPEHGGTKPLLGDNDWTPVQLAFNSGEMKEVTINCLFGAWGRATGTAWFDDIELTAAPAAGLAGEIGRVVRLVTTHYAQRGPVESIIPTLAAVKAASPTLAVPVLDGLVSGWPQGRAPQLGGPEKETLNGLMHSMPESVRDRLLALAQRWGRADLFGADVAAILRTLEQAVANASAYDDERVAAAKRLVSLGDDPEVVKKVLTPVNLLAPPGLAVGLVNAAGESRNPQTGEILAGDWAHFTPAVRRAAAAVLLRRSDWTRALLDAVEQGRLNRSDLATEFWAQLKQNPNPLIARRAERLSAAGSVISADRQEVVAKLLPLAKEKGNAKRGQEVFLANCAVCHVFEGQGGKIGPDLTGVGARERGEILTDILDPNRSVEANYRLWNVTTKDGETYSGRLETETQTSVEILDTTGQKHVVQRKDISALDSSQLSIMPTGFETLPADDLKALLEFLTQPHP